MINIQNTNIIIEESQNYVILLESKIVLLCYVALEESKLIYKYMYFWKSLYYQNKYLAENFDRKYVLKYVLGKKYIHVYFSGSNQRVVIVVSNLLTEKNIMKEEHISKIIEKEVKDYG